MIQPMPNQQVPDYVGDHVQIGFGTGFWHMKALAHHGRVVIANGWLALYGESGELIDSAPLGMVEMKKVLVTMGQTVMATMNGRMYSLSVGFGKVVDGSVTQLGLTFKVGKNIARTVGLIRTFEALTGQKVR